MISKTFSNFEKLKIYQENSTIKEQQCKINKWGNFYLNLKKRIFLNSPVLMINLKVFEIEKSFRNQIFNFETCKTKNLTTLVNNVDLEKNLNFLFIYYKWFEEKNVKLKSYYLTRDRLFGTMYINISPKSL